MLRQHKKIFFFFSQDIYIYKDEANIMMIIMLT